MGWIDEKFEQYKNHLDSQLFRKQELVGRVTFGLFIVVVLLTVLFELPPYFSMGAVVVHLVAYRFFD